jgi:glycosyltransferase involved in cell wall biosynthesis
MIMGGVQRLILDEAEEFARRGIEVWLIVFEPIDTQNTLVGEGQIPMERILYIPYNRMRDVRAFFQTVETLRRIKPDVLFTHHWFANTVGRLIALFIGVRSIAFEHSVYDTVKSRRQFFFDWLLQFASIRIIAVSHSVRDSLLTHGIRRHNIIIIHNGIALDRYTQSVAHTPKREFTFIFIGRLIGDKAVDIFLEALEKVSVARAIIVGTGPQEQALREQSVRLGIERRVHFLGARSDVPALLHTADALVLPSYREGFGLVAIEARAAGLPVILSDFSASTEIIENGVQGIIVPRGDVDALARALHTLLEDENLYHRLATAAPKGLDRFSIRRHIDELIAVAQRP